MSLPLSHIVSGAAQRSALWDCVLVDVDTRGPSIEGVGIHTGKRFRTFLVRNPEHDGLRFCALRGDHVFEAPALWSRLSGTARATALVLRSLSDPSHRERYELKTIEHFLAAAHIIALKGYDLCVEALDTLDEGEAFELPILDGSAARWLSWIEECVGTSLDVPSERLAWKPIRHYELRDGDKSVQIFPHSDDADSRTVLTCTVRFPKIWNQSLDFVCDWSKPLALVEAFRTHIAPARTFGFERELRDLESRGLARGGSLDNAILLRDESLVNPEGFRVPEELAAHKLLDGIGDFALLGAPLIGRIELECAGHSMHLRAVSEAVRKGVLVSGFIDRNGRFQRRDS
ncbi:MAG: UDP-3-O-acyl-N-acetylglucosamine deacetylase [Bdellovibrionota bacterium]